jgi:hypothetical protein
VSKRKHDYEAMNNRSISFFLLVVFTSCTYNNVIKPEKNNELIPPQAPTKWQLIQMTGNIANDPPVTGSNMDWQEWYILYPNHSFTKTRVRDKVTTSASGSYAMVTSSDGQYLELSYPTNNNLIGNCSAEPKEFLVIKSEDELASTWSACDGPGLLYKKVKNKDATEKSGRKS